MSYREKSAWIALVLYVGIYGYYGWTLYDVIEAGQTATFDYWELLITLIVVLVIATIVLESIVAGTSKEAKARADERERMIHFKSANVGYGVAMVGAASVLWAIAVGKPAFYTANGLFLVMVFAETARYAAQIFFFRRGA